jgi:hypothetical protein
MNGNHDRVWHKNPRDFIIYFTMSTSILMYVYVVTICYLKM